MTRKALSIAASTVLWMTSIAALAQAQPNHNPCFRLDIPFDFVEGNRPLPAGTYTIQALLKSVPGIDAIKVVGVRASGRIYTQVADLESRQGSQPGTQLVFQRYGNQFFVSEISDGTTRCEHDAQAEP